MKNKPKIIAAIILSCLHVAISIAQSTLTGKVLDQKTKSPIPYASVYVENTFTGIATKDDGSFSLEVEEGQKGNVFVRVMGYEMQSIAQSAFSQQQLEIYLSSSSYNIQEVAVSAKKALKDPDQIIRKAIKRIPDNMATDYTELEGTYHQAFQDYETDRLLDASQVKVKVGLAGINTKHKTDSICPHEPLSNNVFWESFRYNDDALLPQYQIPDYGTNHLQCLLRMDPVRNHATPTFDFVERLDKEFIENHYFHLDTIGVYNGENVYHIRIYLLNDIRFSQVNVIDGDFDFEEVRTINNPHFEKLYAAHPSRTYLKHLPIGRYATMPIGRVMINTKDLAIVYLEYTNGFGNDRYKYSAEYVKRKEKYYPSKVYFSNKLLINKHPDFKELGEDVENGLKCLMNKKYYNQIVKKHSKSKESRSKVKDIIDVFSIECFKSGITKNFGEYYTKDNPRNFNYITWVTPCTRIVEEILDTFEYFDYQKILHHRYIQFNLSDADSCINVKSDFDRFYYPLGDRSFHWNASRLKRESAITGFLGGRRHVNGYYTGYVGFVPIPFTSTDEYRYVYGAAKDTTLYDKNYLIKGKVSIKAKGDGVYNERYRKKSR